MLEDLFSTESLFSFLLESYNLFFGLSLAFLISWTIYPFQYFYAWIWGKIRAKTPAYNFETMVEAGCGTWEGYLNSLDDEQLSSHPDDPDYELKKSILIDREYLRKVEKNLVFYEEEEEDKLLLDK